MAPATLLVSTLLNNFVKKPTSAVVNTARQYPVSKKSNATSTLVALATGVYLEQQYGVGAMAIEFFESLQGLF